MCGGAETTREDRIIYHQAIAPLIDKALADLPKGPYGYGEAERVRARCVLETLVYRTVLAAEDEGL